ncbi:NitT/TauT family transport system permease protein [Rhodopseudomonas rhenobacensis]|uniref:NitT/TauT family transport system permease protein n=1 Tax=Rhodopseudomonas rhenobacensis TaxID=87461 RepID=A0A7W8E0W6_9BRAD|nr:ABC transporter permease [Rhodopseudomonas rhenobacensis]MBB5049548.1 NitT/TauT family transport system permease protein [Rhodopseudomonas rhenobacensis]
MRLINLRPSRQLAIYMAALPFVLVAIGYVLGSEARLAENPNDKLLPALSTMAQAVKQMAFQLDARTGSYLMLSDTIASLGRLLSALAISTAAALVFGIVIGLLPAANAMLGSFVSVTSMVPPLALLPILFIVMGLGENSKIALIVIGTLPGMIRDLSMRVLELPREQLIKAQTLGASSWQIALRVVLPQILPRLIDSLRLQLGPAWLFLIAAEAIASDSGLGYRIFLVRRYLAMDIIIPYVIWITLLAFLMDFALRLLQRKAFPWFASVRAE